ncbi:hypothetical protein E2C01_052137 [Portunus trituberculatus]|uniref:Uncharacterized protein n=1 Tax=Portunus trituberculatus TaxID=210409 RepID=A0A5B7GKV8_PORTR|nr:hypothetical protein [Portunus trituberculatus]
MNHQYHSGLLVVLHPPPVSILVTAGYRSACSPPLHPSPFLAFSLGSCTRVLPGTAVFEVDGRGTSARATTSLRGLVRLSFNAKNLQQW